MDCERCGTELPEEGNFCSNCGAPRPVEGGTPTEETRPCRKCDAQVQVGAAFCWNCGVESPHRAPAQTGHTVVTKKPRDEQAQPAADEEDPDKGGVEWEDHPTGKLPPLEEAALGASTMRMGTGSPPPVTPEATEPKAVSPGLPPEAKRGMETSFADHDDDEPPTTPRLVVSMIAEELGEDLQTGALSDTPQAVDDDGSQPLLLEPDVDAAVAKVVLAKSWPDLAEEVSELQFLMLRGFTAEAKDALQLLIDAHPGHPDLEPLCQELDVSANPPVVSKAPSIGPRENTAPKSVPDVTKVNLKSPVGDGDDAPPPVEMPTSPSFVEGTSPPPGGFAPSSAAPQVIEPNVTPRLGIESPRRMHVASSDSLPTMPRMSTAEVEAAVDASEVGIRLVMLGTRGQAVWERTFPAGQSLEVGRDPKQPWGDDPHLEPQHARLHATNEGIRIETLGQSGVYRQVDERLAVRDGDEFRVGESLLRYTATGGWGSLTWFPLSGSSSTTIPVGGAGIMVGRENADIEIPEDTFVSGAHCRFSCRDEGLFVEDLGSANGTYTRVRTGETVPFGGLLLLGQTQFKVRRNAE